MGKNSNRTKVERKRRTGKRVENMAGASEDPAPLAIEAAIAFVAHAILKERMAGVIGAPVGQTEAKLRGSVGALPSIEELLQKRNEDGPGFGARVAEVDRVLARNSRAMIASLTKEFQQAHRERRFRALFTILAGERNAETAPDQFYNYDAARDEIAERCREIERLKVLITQNPEQIGKLMERAKAFEELIDPPALKTETEFRAAIAKQLGNDEATVRRLERSTGLRLRKTG